MTAHVAAKAEGSTIDGRTTRRANDKVSQRKRKLVEETFGWGKTIVGMAKVKVRGLVRVRYKFTLAMAAYNLIRMPRLLATARAARAKPPGRNRLIAALEHQEARRPKPRSMIQFYPRPKFNSLPGMLSH